MPEKPLHLVQIDSPLDEPRGERVPHIVEPKVWNASSIASLTELILLPLKLSPPLRHGPEWTEEVAR